MLSRSYRIPAIPSEKVSALAEKVTSLVVNSDVTYEEAEATLETAMRDLETKARLVIPAELPQCDSESKS
ncbi:MAG: hypothetical protein HFF08_11665 [Oscillospiraceae bacterium]|jgi:hypothetical protein|nr:hypothetical protein [Oscillospiraceae bacterium]MCI8844724.1 hypothetical protein [Oscillospiraceae bacterium]